jgi:hypothetical protein
VQEKDKLLSTIDQLRQVQQGGSGGERDGAGAGGEGMLALERRVEELTNALQVQTTVAADKIAFQNFVVNDVALFLPTPGRPGSNRR